MSPDPRDTAPSIDNQTPQIDPNMASDPDLCKEIIQFIYRNYFYPYLLNQQRLHSVWLGIDRAWRCMNASSDLSYDPFAEKSEEWNKRVGSGKNNGNASVSPSDIYQQVNALSTMAFGLSWKNGVPAKFKKPETLTEHPLYNPNQQAVAAANERLGQESNKSDLRLTYRKCYPDYIKFSHTWALYDYDRRFEAVMDPTTGQPVLIPSTFFTRAEKLNIDQVYIDYLVSVSPIESQDCPIIRRMVTKSALFKNEYEPQVNPFGWLNIDDAISETSTLYAMSKQDMQYASALLQTRYGISDSSAGQRPVTTVKQLYTAFAMLPIYQDETGKFKITNEAIDVTGPDGTPQKAFIRPQRFIVEWYGYPDQRGGICLRIQKNPTAKDKVPLRCIVHKVEDTSMSIPVSVSEIAWGAYNQLATAQEQFHDSKNYTINRPWKVNTNASGLLTKNLNKPGSNIPVDDPSDAVRAEAQSYDETITLIPYMQMMKGEIKNIFGATDTLLGEVSSGRRAASEIMTAADSARTPIIVDIDSFNRQFVGAYAEFMLDNLNKWGDRDWIRKRTGLEWFPNMEIETDVASDVMDNMIAQQNTRYFIETFGNNPMFAQYLNTPGAIVKLAQLMGIRGIEEVINDGGYEQAKAEAMQTVTRILGDGEPVPPSPEDPDELFLTVFQQALKDPYWQKSAPQNIPILIDRIGLQQQQAMMKQMQEMRAQIMQQQMALTAQADEKAGKAGPGRASSGTAPTSPGRAFQQEAGRSMGGN